MAYQEYQREEVTQRASGKQAFFATVLHINVFADFPLILSILQRHGAIQMHEGSAGLGLSGRKAMEGETGDAWAGPCVPLRS